MGAVRFSPGATGPLVSGFCLAVAVGLLSVGLRAAVGAANGGTSGNPIEDTSTRDVVGLRTNNHVMTPVNQWVQSAGRQVYLPEMRPQAIALSPDGKLLVTSGKKSELVVLDPATTKILQHVPLPSEQANEPDPGAVSTRILEPDKKGQLSFTGLIFSRDGKRIYLANVNGSVKVFGVTNGVVTGLYSLPLPGSRLAARVEDIPAGLALSPDGRKLYVVLNLSNRLLELDTATGKTLRLFDVGFAPYDVVLQGDKAYVSNWGGRRADTNSLTGPAGHGTRVRVDPVRHIASEGSVSVVDLAAGKTCAEIMTGLHASGLALAPDGRHLVVANAGADTLSVIDTRSDAVVETLFTRFTPEDVFGASPNALTFDPGGKRLYVCNGTLNAIAVIDFAPGRSRLRGMIPTGWFPGAVAFDARRKTLHVANVKGIGPVTVNPKTGKVSSNTHQYYGSVSSIPLPGTTAALERMTAQVQVNCRLPAIRAARLPARADAAPRPVPERVGEPSPIKHVVYIIKENRTYDQVLGDIPQGNGVASLCIYGEKVTPNQHKMVRQFVLLDNTYCSGILSADGHQWADTAFATDYMEKSFAGFPRSYPDGMDDDDVDALAYSPAGFLWDNAILNKRSLRIYGEFAVTQAGWKDSSRRTAPSFTDYYRHLLEPTGEIYIYSRPTIESIRPYLCTNTVGWDMKIPDVFRATEFIKELREFERRGTFPNLTIICLPNDHTSGTKAGAPTPAAQVADNDLAFGQILEALSRSPFWKETCVFAIEDDPQDGWDHVSGYRTSAYVLGPYVKRGAVVSTQYNQTSLIRTMELILGLPPMNVMDASATPMFDCFTSTPDLTPFEAVPSGVPLNQMNPDPKKIGDTLLRRHAKLSAKLPLEEPDRCPEGLFNRILWHAAKGSSEPYPVWATRGVHGDDDDGD